MKTTAAVKGNQYVTKPLPDLKALKRDEQAPLVGTFSSEQCQSSWRRRVRSRPGNCASPSPRSPSTDAAWGLAENFERRLVY